MSFISLEASNRLKHCVKASRRVSQDSESSLRIDHKTAPTYVSIMQKNCSVYIQCKGDIVVVDIKQRKSQFTNSDFTITQSAKFF